MTVTSPQRSFSQHGQEDLSSGWVCDLWPWRVALRFLLGPEVGTAEGQGSQIIMDNRIHTQITMTVD